MTEILREHVPIEETWDLTDIFPSDAEWEQSYEAIEQQLDRILEQEIVLSNSSEVLEALSTLDSLLEGLDRTVNYARYKYSEDESNPANQTMMGRAQFLTGKADNVRTNYVNALLQIPSETMNQYLNFLFLTIQKLLEQVVKHCPTIHLFPIPILPQVNLAHRIVLGCLTLHLFF